VNGLSAVWIASLLGSLHCVGMCGGLVGFYAGTDSTPGPGRWASHATYHLSRLLAYCALGAGAGQLGAAVDLAGSFAGAQHLAALAAGASMVVWGGLTLLRSRSTVRSGATRGLVELRPSASRGRPGALARLQASIIALSRRARGQPPVRRAALLGLTTGLLPCGWLYAFVVIAAGAGSAQGGALSMAAFWAGSVPALLGLGLGVQLLAQRVRAQIPRVAAAALVALGLITIAGRFPLPASAHGAGAEPPACHAVH
jgi:sulfite exporter TauE/SafE